MSLRRRTVRSTLTYVSMTTLAACGSGGGETAGTGSHPPASISVASGNNQTGEVGAPLTTALSVKIVDASGNGAVSVSVAWAVTGGNGSLAPSASTTGAGGVASTTWTLGQSAGSNTATATVVSLPAASFTATGIAGAVSSVTVSPATPSVVVGETVTLSAALRDQYGNVATGTVAWSSGTAAVANVSPLGVVTAVAQGTAVIAAAAGGKQGQATVTVTRPPLASITISAATSSLRTGSVLQLTAVSKDVTGAVVTPPLTWASSNPQVATISTSGLVTGLAQGATTITATASSLMSNAFALTLTPALSIALSGSQTLTIDGAAAYLVSDSITISGNARLTIRNSNVTVRVRNALRAVIELHDNARLEVVNSRVVPALTDPANLYLFAENTSSVLFDHATFYNAANFVGDATFTITNGSSIHSGNDIPEQAGAFGIVQVCCRVRGIVDNSELGSIGLFYGPGESATLENLRTGTPVSLALPRLTLTNTTVRTPQKKGPFERGWAVFADQDSRVTVRNATLNKFVLQEIRNQSVSYQDLATERPVSISFWGNSLQNVIVYNEWGFFTRNANVTLTNSRGVWLFPFETGTQRLVNSTMIEFDPRGFTGEIAFDNATWENAGEIIENNNFRMSGTVVMNDPELRRSLVWDANSRVRRIFAPAVELLFNASNFTTRQSVVIGGTTCLLDFFSTTPLRC